VGRAPDAPRTGIAGARRCVRGSWFGTSHGGFKAAGTRRFRRTLERWFCSTPSFRTEALLTLA
jgi:hypothetical protein